MSEIKSFSNNYSVGCPIYTERYVFGSMFREEWRKCDFVLQNIIERHSEDLYV